mgnify:CR=1 FL=1
MMTRIQQIVVAVGILAFAASGAEGQEIVLHNGDTLDGLKMTWDGQNPKARLETNTDKQFISEGSGSIFAGSVAPEGTDHTSYVAFRFPVDPLDMKNHALAFEVWSSEPENTLAFHVRGLNAQGKIVAGWGSWFRPLVFNAQTMMLVPGTASGKLRWEEHNIEAPESDIVFLEFIVGSRSWGQAYNMYVDNIRLEPAKASSE